MSFMLTFINATEFHPMPKYIEANLHRKTGLGKCERCGCVLRNLYTICCCRCFDFRFLRRRTKNVCLCKHINVYQSNRNQTDNSSPHRNIAKYYKGNRNAPIMMMMMMMMGEASVRERHTRIIWIKFNQFLNNSQKQTQNSWAFAFSSHFWISLFKHLRNRMPWIFVMTIFCL